MELLRTVKRRTAISETIYVVLNLGLAAAILAVTVITGTMWGGLALIFLSKWRVLAVRPRFWYKHIESNLVDVTVSVSTLTLIYLAGQSAQGGFNAQVIITLFYVLWLLLLKPASRKVYVSMQAGAAIFVGSMAVTSVAYSWWSVLYVFLIWLIGYSSASHVLASRSEKNVKFLSLVWGLVCAELAWLFYHWTIAYELPFMAGLRVPQISFVLIALSFLSEKLYVSQHRHEKIMVNDVLLPIIFVLALVVVIFVGFGAPSQ